MISESVSFIFEDTMFSKFKSDYQAFAAIIKSCAETSNIELGTALHNHIVKLGHLSCLFVSKALLNLYAKGRAFVECQKLFSEIASHDSVTWNIVLSGFAGSQNHNHEVINLFYSMHICEHLKPTSVSIAIILPVCARVQALGAGKSVHAYAIKSGLESHTLVGNALISMYAKSGNTQNEAYAVFSRIYDKDVVSWNAMIAGLAENKLMDDACRLFSLMLQGPTVPNYATIVSILPVCAFLETNVAYNIGRKIHTYVLRRSELVMDVSVINALMSFYLRIGRIKEAESLFHTMKMRDLVSWNSIISGYASNGEGLRAFELFHQFLGMESSGPDSVTLVSILPVCAQLHNLHVGKQIHGYVIRHTDLCNDTAVGNALISLYAKFGDIEAANRIFLWMPKKDLISWNAMLDAFAQSQFGVQFLNLLHWMFREGIKPDSITILTTVQFCATIISQLDKIKEVHGFSIRSGLFPCDCEPNLANTIIDAYGKCGNIEYAMKIFEIFSGKKNTVTCNAIISAFVNCGSHEEAHVIFNRMSERDLTTWNLMVRAYAENEYPSQAIDLFYELQFLGMKPDIMTIMSLLPVCSQLASAQMLRQCHGYVVRSCFEDLHLKGALLDVYSKCGRINCAARLFQSTPQKDLIIFTAMVGGYAMHGMAEDAIKIFFHMLELGVKPDHIIITAVLSACSHAGLVNEGLKIFYSLERVYSIKPTVEQYACVVDLLARTGQINEAYSFVTKMPVEANANIWGTLLGACRNHHEVEIGSIIADHLLNIEVNNIGNYVVMSNLYAANARWDGVLEMRKLMRARDLKKPAGCSWIEVERTKNVFIAGDSSHPQRTIIYGILKTLDQQIKQTFQF